MPEICSKGKRWNGKKCISRAKLDKRAEELADQWKYARNNPDYSKYERWWYALPLWKKINNRKTSSDVFTKELFKRRFNREPRSNDSYYAQWVDRVKYAEIYSMDGETMAVIEEMINEGY
jgi:hypothetical protein